MYEVFEQLLQKFGVTTADVCKASGNQRCQTGKVDAI